VRIEKLCKLKLVMKILNKAKYGGDNDNGRRSAKRFEKFETLGVFNQGF
jgi:hypothetical protein